MTPPRYLAVCLLTLAMSLFTAAGAEPAWKEYRNARFGFVLAYPAALTASRAPANGGGREWHSANGEFSVTAEGHFLQVDDGDSLEKRWQEELKERGATVTYKKQAATWYVVSGVTKEGAEFYHKFCVKGSNWAAFTITYPHAKDALYSPWVARIEKRFVPFPAGNFDRVP